MPRAVHRLQRRDEVVEIVVLGEDVEVAPDRLRYMVLEHGDDQLVLALEVRIERAAGEAGACRSSAEEAEALPTAALQIIFISAVRHRHHVLRLLYRVTERNKH
ncbi:hypothetical protein [Bradyrhizobium shewense]|uniref:hypothetical protein n=1 Tax=Bradyrhizobium shewense TaxID=1761772 RepID=UPI003D32142D